MTTAPITFGPVPRTEPAAYAVPQRPRHLKLVPSPQLTIDDIEPSPKPITAPRGSAHPHSTSGAGAAFVRTYFTAVAEVMVGRRSADQISKFTNLNVHQWLRSLVPHRSATSAAVATPRVRAVHVCEVRSGVLEATAVIQHGPHVRAMNSRFVELDEHWQCVQLQLV